MENELYQLKWEYNNTLNRYYNGCNYLEENVSDTDKYMPLLLELLTAGEYEALKEAVEEVNMI